MKLATALGMVLPDDAAALGPVVSRISLLLGSHAGTVQAFDNPPRPNEYVAAFDAATVKASELSASLKAMSAPLQEQLQICLYHVSFELDLDELVKSIDYLGAALHEGKARAECYTAAEIKDGRADPNRGRPRAVALPLLIRELRELFLAHYRGPCDAARSHGFVTLRAEVETRERDFILAALEDAELAPSLSTFDKLLRKVRTAD